MPPRVELQLRWHDELLVHDEVAVPATLAAVARRAGIRIDPSVRIRLDAVGRLCIEQSGRVTTGSRDDCCLQIEPGVALHARRTEFTPFRPSGSSDRGFATIVVAMAIACLVVVGLAVRGMDTVADSRDADSLRTLRALVARAVASGATATRTQTAQRTGATLPVTEPGEPTPTLFRDRWRRRSARLALRSPDPAEFARRVAGRTFAPFVTPGLLRAVARAQRAFDGITHGAVERPADPDRASAYATLGRAGVGHGRECLGDDCAPVDVGESPIPSWMIAVRPIASNLAARPLAQRASRVVAPRMSVDVDGELTANDVRRIVRRAVLPDVVRCYDGELRQRELPSGRLSIAFSVRPDGHVGSVALERTAIHEPAIEQCMLRAIGAYQFPPSRTGASVVYPIVVSAWMPDR